MSERAPGSACASPDPGAGAGVDALRRRALDGTVWTIGGFGAANALRLLSNVLLARLLFPEAFGLMAMVHVFIQGLWLFTDIGVGPAIVQSKRGEERDYLDTAFTLQALRGLALCLVSFLIAWPVAALYSRQDPLAADLLYYIPVTGLTAILDGVVSTRLHVYARHLRVRQLTLFDLSTQGFSLVVTVLAAWLYPSVWALVIGTIAKSVARTALSHLVIEGPVNRARWDPEAARALLQFGKWVAVSTLLTFLASQADRLIFCAFVPLEVLGVYGIAVALAAMPVGALLQLGNKIIFPILSRLRDRAGEQTREARRVRLPLLLGAGAIVSALIPAGPALIDLLYDARYAGAGWMLQLLVVGAWFQVLECPNTALLLARGETSCVAGGNAAKLVGVCALLPVGFAAGGFPGALLGLVVADVAKYATTALLVRRRGLRVLRLDAAATALVALSALAGTAAAGAVAVHPLVTLLLASATACAPWALGAAWSHARRARLASARPAPAPAV